MGKIILITGGTKAGKSSFAQELAMRLSADLTYIATGQSLDLDTAKQIEQYRLSTSSNWKIVKAPGDLIGAIGGSRESGTLLLIDCLPLWISNLLLSGSEAGVILREVERLVETVRAIENTVILISNEVGMGIVSDDPLARNFSDIVGRTNQIVARAADEVYLVVSGIETRLK